MGAYLSSPIRDKETEEGENDSFKYGISAMQGWRTDMEDAHAAVLNLHPESGTKNALFAVLDGHGGFAATCSFNPLDSHYSSSRGAEVARFVARHIARVLVSSEAFQANDTERALREAYLRMDELLVKEEHHEELKSLRTKESEEGGDRVINGASLPESLLEALGMPSGGGFQIKLVRSGPGERGIAIDDIEKVESGDEDCGTVVELVEGDAEEEEGEGFVAAEAAAAHDRDAIERNSKRKRDDKATGMAVDSTAEGSRSTGEEEETAPQEADEVVEADDEATPEKDDYVGPSAGCTAVCAVVRNGTLYVANAGDSRCVLCRGGKAIAMTQDHKPMDEAEYARIMKAGGFVADGRVNGSLNLSRAIGDLNLKANLQLDPKDQIVTAYPDVTSAHLTSEDTFLMLACDGIWDVLTNQEAVDFVRERVAAGKAPREVCEELCNRCLASDPHESHGIGSDNMTVQIVVFKPAIFH